MNLPDLATLGSLPKATPVQIDTVFAELVELRARATSFRNAHLAVEARARKSLESMAEENAALWGERYRTQIASAAESARDQQRIIDLIILHGRPLESEFRARGGWTRAYLVPQGHLHLSRSCSTCFPTTAFHWVVQLSGADETAIVEAAADRACTVCFPTAPVEVRSRPSTLETPDEAAAAKARVQRDADRARKAAMVEAKAIAAPDGTALVEPGKFGETIRTLVTAERTAVLLTSEYVHAVAAQKWTPNPEYAINRLAWRDQIVEAIAHKRGVTVAEVMAEIDVKATAKFKRDWA